MCRPASKATIERDEASLSPTVEFLQRFQTFLNFRLPDLLFTVVVLEEGFVQGISAEDQLLQRLQFSLEGNGGPLPASRASSTYELLEFGPVFDDVVTHVEHA